MQHYAFLLSAPFQIDKLAGRRRKSKTIVFTGWAFCLFCSISHIYPDFFFSDRRPSSSYLPSQSVGHVRSIWHSKPGRHNPVSIQVGNPLHNFEFFFSFCVLQSGSCLLDATRGLLWLIMEFVSVELNSIVSTSLLRWGAARQPEVCEWYDEFDFNISLLARQRQQQPVPLFNHRQCDCQAWISAGERTSLSILFTRRCIHLERRSFRWTCATFEKKNGLVENFICKLCHCDWTRARTPLSWQHSRSKSKAYYFIKEATRV